MRVALDDLEAREERRCMERPGDLAGPTADAVDQLALRDDRREVTDVEITYPGDLAKQMLGWSGKAETKQKQKPVEQGASR